VREEKDGEGRKKAKESRIVPNPKLNPGCATDNITLAAPVVNRLSGVMRYRFSYRYDGYVSSVMKYRRVAEESTSLDSQLIHEPVMELLS